MAAARIVAPKTTPLIPARPAMTSPLCSRATPATSVTSAPAANTATAARVPSLRCVRSARFSRACPRRFSWPSGGLPNSCHGSPRRARPTSHRPAGPCGDDEDRRRLEPPVGDPERKLRPHHRDHEDGDHDHRLEDERERCGTVGEAVVAAQADGVHHGEDDGLDRDPAEDVADGDAEVVGECGADRDRDLGQIGGDREEDRGRRAPPRARGGWRARRSCPRA